MLHKAHDIGQSKLLTRLTNIQEKMPQKLVCAGRPKRDVETTI
jgi:hypothetical protein